MTLISALKLLFTKRFRTTFAFFTKELYMKQSLGKLLLLLRCFCSPPHYSWAGSDLLNGYPVLCAHISPVALNQGKGKRKMRPDRVSNQEPLALESDALPTAARGLGKGVL